MKLKTFFFVFILVAEAARAADPKACDNYICSAERTETKLLQESSGVFTRKGTTLSLKIHGDVEKKWTDGSPDSADSIFYRLTAYYPAQKLAAITRFYYENSDELLINLKSGAEQKIEAFHHLSEGGDLFVADLGEDYESGTTPNVAKIYFCEVTAKNLCKLVKEFPDFAGRKIKWKKAGEFDLELSKETPVEKRKPSAYGVSIDIFSTTGKCTKETCTSTAPKFVRTESF